MNRSNSRLRRVSAGGVLALLVVSPLSGLIAQTPEDACEDARLLVSGSVSGNTAAAGNDGAAGCGRSETSPDVWFRYRAPARGLLRLSTCGSGFDTVLSVHSECPGTEANQIACNDDACGVQSTLVVTVDAGEEVQIRVSGFNQAAGSFQLEVDLEELAETAGPDAAAIDVDSIDQLGRLGDEVAFSMRTTICNLGDAPMDWYRTPDPRHPFLVFNLYRLEADRIEQIGQSWVKHGFSASQGSDCGTGCSRVGNGERLGVGCSDIYGVSTNGRQTTFGPRTEIDPVSGGYEFQGSHLDVNASDPHDPVVHRLRVLDDDLDPALHPSARYFTELHVIAHDDSDPRNNVAHKELFISGLSGGEWQVTLASGRAAEGSVLWSWLGALYDEAPEAGRAAREGSCFLAVKTTSLADGLWRYEYAVHNLNYRAAVRSFSVPVPTSARVEEIESFAPRSHDEGFANTEWVSVREAGELRFSTARVGEPGAHPLRWGTVHTFRFVCDLPPVTSTLTLEPYDHSRGSAFEAVLVGPRGDAAPVFRRGDADANGVVEMADAISTLGFLFLGSSAPRCADAADTNDSGLIDVSDAVATLGWLFSGGAAPDAPGPFLCGLDPVEENPALPPCGLDACP